MADTLRLEHARRNRDGWVTVASYSQAAMAHVARLQLDAADIPSYIDNEFTAMTLCHILPAVGFVLVKVPEQFAEEAIEVLRNEDPELYDQDSDDEYDYEDDDAIVCSKVARCPQCHSTDTEPLSWGWRIGQSMVILLLAGSLTVQWPVLLLCTFAYVAYFIWSKPSHRCLRCRHRFTALRIAQ